ncbi:HAD family hydrolase [Streptomyces sp. NPDC013740]|uniref:HAD family hydrolase n=1 Tax=Streptomyces sp. NPDC013740 TaxID=3364867 RepID=UPI00370202AC
MSIPRVSVIFDLDGTLVDSEPNYFEATRRTLAAHGVTAFDWRRHTEFIGIGTLESLQALAAEYGVTAPVETLLDATNRHYLELARAGTPVFPEMRAFVERLYGQGVPMAVASGSSPAAIGAVLAGTGLDAYLTPLVSAEEVDRGKPAPDVFLEAARRLGARPEHCLVLEDAAPGAAAARAAGMRCLALPYVPGTADDPAFATADLVFPGGQREFTARAALAWLDEWRQSLGMPGTCEARSAYRIVDKS